MVWTGQSTRHVREGVEPVLDQEGLRRALLAVSPMAFFNKFARWPKKSLMIYTKYDLTFLPEFSRQAAGEFARRHLNTIVRCLPCGHYTLGRDSLQIHGRMASVPLYGAGVSLKKSPPVDIVIARNLEHHT